MKKNLISISLVFSLTAGLVLGLAIGQGWAQRESLKEIGNEFQAGGQKSAEPPEEAIARPRVEYQAQSFRDPFQNPFRQKAEQSPERQVASAPPNLTVQGVVWGGNFPQAIINHKVVKEGDIIEGARVDTIGKEGVSVSFQGSEFTLSAPAAGGKADKKP